MTDTDRELSELVRRHATRYRAPEVLLKRIDVALEAADAASVKPRRPALKQSWAQWLHLGAAFAFGVLISVGATTYVMNQSSQANMVEEEVFSSHMRSLMPGHSFDVASSDQHTVKPWFNGKLDFSPPVSDLTSEGFPLVGGRLDYINQRATATLVYRRRLHAIDVYIWPLLGEQRREAGLRSRKGFHAYAWADGDMQFWAVSDIPAPELEAFAQRLRQHLSELMTN